MILISLGRLPKESEQEQELADRIINEMDGYGSECYETDPDSEGIAQFIMETSFARVDWEEKIWATSN